MDISHLLFFVFLLLLDNVSAAAEAAAFHSAQDLIGFNEVAFVLDDEDNCGAIAIMKHDDVRQQIYRKCRSCIRFINKNEQRCIIGMMKKAYTHDYDDETSKTYNLKAAVSNRPFDFRIPFESLLLAASPHDDDDGLMSFYLECVNKLSVIFSDRGGCINLEATTNFQSFIQNSFSHSELCLWQNPFPGVWRDSTKVTVPCDDSYWVKEGAWHVMPMWASETKGTSVSKCTNDKMSQIVDIDCSVFEGLSGRCSLTWSYFCPDYVINNKNNNEVCAAFVFLLNNNKLNLIESFIRNFGCDVHVSISTEYENGNVGQFINSLYHNDNGNELKDIKFLQVSCDGCEWELLNVFRRDFPHLLEKVCNINLDIQLIDETETNPYAQLVLLAQFFRNYLEVEEFRVWYLHANPFRSSTDCRVHPLLVELGFDPACCYYEIGLRRSTPNCISMGLKEENEEKEEEIDLELNLKSRLQPAAYFQNKGST